MWIELTLVAAAVGGLVAAGVRSALFSRDATLRRALRGASRRSIRDVREGEIVKLTGVVRGLGPLVTAPLSRAPCVASSTKLEEPADGSWGERAHEVQAVDFVVEDATGCARVVTSHVELHAVHDREVSDAKELEALLARHGGSSRGLVLNRDFRYREAVFEPGQRVSVLGVCRFEAEPGEAAGSGYRDVPKRVVVEAPSGGAVIVSQELGAD